ncbi:MAG: hypothetical protein ABMA64_37210 [Myxococcota bacterium]
MWLWFALARAEVVDRVVAVVKGQPVLASDVRLDELLAPFDPAPVPFWTTGRPAEEVEIDAAIVRWVASDVSLYQPSHEAIAERVAALRAEFGPRWEGFLADHGLDQERLTLTVRRRMVVERYLLRTLQADPADRAAWTAASEAVLVELRAEIPVRRIALRGEEAQ